MECEYPKVFSAPSKDDQSPSTSVSKSSHGAGHAGPSSNQPAHQLPAARSPRSSPRPRHNDDPVTINSPNASMVRPFEIRHQLMWPPGSSPETKIVEFLAFHHKFVIPSHYFWWNDSRGLCSWGLLNLASNSDSMRYAVAAYSALLYSVFMRDRKAREYAFLYYAQSVYCVQAFVKAPSEKPTLPVLATILELTSFEVHLSPLVR